MKLQTTVECNRCGSGISYKDKIMVLGSCFADNIGDRLLKAGFDVCVNPFGTLYNPVSVCNSVTRLASGIPFSENECVEMGAKAGLICSFSHHTLMARPTAEEFLEVANASFGKASAFFKGCNKVIITLGTAWIFRHNGTGETVSNCLKRDASEFTRERLSVGSVVMLLERMVSRFPEKEFIFTVSPIRHLKDGAHGNQISKSTLLLALEDVCGRFDNAGYFPSYEIMMDELRDYRFYAADMVHPSDQAVEYIWERFTDVMLPEGEKEKLLENEKLERQSRHRPLH